jgi:hypothetical protein
MKLGAALAVLAWYLSAIPVDGRSQPPDPFLQQHAAAIARNIYGAFSIRFTDERRTFHAREPIAIDLVYERGAQLTLQPEDGPEALSLTQARFDRVVDAPLRIVDSKFDDHLPGGTMGCVSYAPIVLRRRLTDLYRFDTPGRYRMFLQSRQVTPQFETSNILEFEILPRDAAWERNVLERAQRALVESPLDKRVVVDAFHTLRTLATNDATAVLARYYQTGMEDLESRDVEYGLLANPNRGFVVDVLVRELLMPERRFGWRFMPTLARLELARRHPDGPPFSHDEYLDVTRQFARARARALNLVAGRLSREMRNELMAYPSGQDHFVRGVVTPAARDFPQEATAAFRRLSAEAQRSRLLGTWRRFADPVFLPLLRSLYQARVNGSNEVRDVALRRLFQLAPHEGRALMRAELQRDRLRVSMETIAMLPDRAFPRYERRWVELLERATTERDRRSAAQRIERFGTGRIAQKVLRFYDREQRRLSCGSRAVLLAYLVRVDPKRGRVLLVKAATSFMWDETCSGSVLEDAAELEGTSNMELAALQVLAGRDADAAGSAARALSQYGSVSVRPALEQRLNALHVVIRQRGESPNSSVREQRGLHNAEYDLMSALAGARSWTLTREEQNRLADRCLLGSCGNLADVSWSDPSLSMIAPRPRIGDEAQLPFFIAGYSGRSLADLDRKLRQFPPGTRIYWDDHPWDGRDSLDRWTWVDRDELFERVRRDAARHGVILQRERTLRSGGDTLKFGPWVEPKSAPASSLVHSHGRGRR